MAIGAYEVEGKFSEAEYEKVVKKFGASLIDEGLAKKIDHPPVPEVFFAHKVNRRNAHLSGGPKLPFPP